MSFFAGLFIGILFSGLVTAAFVLQRKHDTEIEEWSDELYQRASVSDAPRVSTRIVNRERTIEL